MLLILAIGVFIGSFLAVLAKRTPIGEYFTNNRSQCESCKEVLNIIDLIPFYNLLFHKNKCRYCGTPIHFYHSLFEIITGLLFLLFYHHFSFSLETLYILFLWLMAITLSLTDYLYYLVDPKILYFFSIITSCFYYATHQLSLDVFFSPFFIVIVFLILTICMPNSIGGGDIKLLIAWSFFLSLTNILWLILIASLLGIIFIFFTKLTTNKKIEKIPFVPFLSIALILVTIYFY